MNHLTTIEKILLFREAGAVQRAHTSPHPGEYSIATHSFNALNLLFILYPGDPSNLLVRALLWHDVPERWTGDVPSPTKASNPLLRKVLDDLEDRIFKRLGIDDIFRRLSTNEQKWLRAIDLLELFCWAEEQIAFGNKIGLSFRNKIVQYFKERYTTTPREVLDVVELYKWKRMPECDEFLEGI